MDFTKSRIHPDFIAAVLMIGMAVSEIYTTRMYLDGLFTDFSYGMHGTFLNVFAEIIGAAILLLTKHRGIVRTMVVSTLVFAFIEINDAVMWLVYIGEYIRDLDYFIYGVVPLIIGLVLVGNLIVYRLGASNNLVLMFYSFGCILLLEVIQELNYYRIGTGILGILRDMAPKMCGYLLIMLVMMILLSDTVKVNTMMYNVNQNSRQIRGAAVPAGVRIDRSEIPKIEDVIANGMENDSYTVLLNSYYQADYMIVLKDDGGRISLCFSSCDDDTGVGMARFIAKGLITDTGDAETCDTVRIYGDDLFFIQMIAGGPYVDRKAKMSLKELIDSFRKEDAVVCEEE